MLALMWALTWAPRCAPPIRFCSLTMNTVVDEQELRSLLETDGAVENEIQTKQNQDVQGPDKAQFWPGPGPGPLVFLRRCWTLTQTHTAELVTTSEMFLTT